MISFVHCIRTAILACCLTLVVFTSTAQSLALGKVEAGIGLGPLIFLGDLGGNLGRGTTFIKDVNPSITNLAKGAYLNYYPAEWIGFRLAFNTGKLEGADSLINEKGGAETYRKSRNLHFRSNLTELYAAMEIYPTYFLERYDGLAGKLRPYGLIGVGMFRFNPQALYNSPNGTSRWVNLQPLRIEGQGMAEYPDQQVYKLTQVEIPMGAGVKYYVSDDFYLGFEVLHRKTFTDYIDDVSTNYINPELYDKYLQPQDAVVAKQVYFRGINANNARLPPDGEMRGQRKNNDSFFSSILRLGWRLYSDNTPGQMRCPKF